jgi:hypothetical protein
MGCGYDYLINKFTDSILKVKGKCKTCGEIDLSKSEGWCGDDFMEE